MYCRDSCWCVQRVSAERGAERRATQPRATISDAGICVISDLATGDRSRGHAAL